MDIENALCPVFLRGVILRILQFAHREEGGRWKVAVILFMATLCLNWPPDPPLGTRAFVPCQVMEEEVTESQLKPYFSLDVAVTSTDVQAQ